MFTMVLVFTVFYAYQNEVAESVSIPELALRTWVKVEFLDFFVFFSFF